MHINYTWDLKESIVKLFSFDKVKFFRFENDLCISTSFFSSMDIEKLQNFLKVYNEILWNIAPGENGIVIHIFKENQ